MRNKPGAPADAIGEVRARRRTARFPLRPCRSRTRPRARLRARPPCACDRRSGGPSRAPRVPDRPASGSSRGSVASTRPRRSRRTWSSLLASACVANRLLESLDARGELGLRGRRRLRRLHRWQRRPSAQSGGAGAVAAGAAAGLVCAASSFICAFIASICARSSAISAFSDASSARAAGDANTAATASASGSLAETKVKSAIRFRHRRALHGWAPAKERVKDAMVRSLAAVSGQRRPPAHSRRSGCSGMPRGRRARLR